MSTLFTLNSPIEPTKSCDIIKDVVTSIGGKIKSERDNVIRASWRSPKMLTVFPMTFVFYVGKDMIRVTTSAAVINGMFRVWDYFLTALCSRYPDINYGVIPGEAVLDAVKIVDNGTEQVFTSTSYTRPSVGGALLGGMLFGSTGAILGGMNTHTMTSGKTTTQFSKSVLATIRYTNGHTLDEVINKNTPFYHKIMANMSVFNK